MGNDSNYHSSGAYGICWPDWNKVLIMDDWPSIEEFNIHEWKLLFKLLCENPEKLELDKGLSEFGKQQLHSVQRKIGIRVVGVDCDA